MLYAIPGSDVPPGLIYTVQIDAASFKNRLGTYFKQSGELLLKCTVVRLTESQTWFKVALVAGSQLERNTAMPGGIKGLQSGRASFGREINIWGYKNA